MVDGALAMRYVPRVCGPDVRVGRNGDGFHQTASHQAGSLRYLRAHSHPGGALPNGYAANKRERRLEAIRFYNSWKWKELRYQVLTHYGPECMLCGATRHDGRRIVVDHIKPRSKHPELELSFDNCQVLCNSCNKGKSYVDESDFRPDKSGTPTKSDTKGDEAPSNRDAREETFSPEVQFLVRNSKTGRAHLWHDNDTLCHMASAGGLNPRRYRLVGYNPGLPVCTMCRRIARHQGLALD